MPASIRGHSTQLKIIKNGGDTDIVDITKFESNQDSTFQRTFYVGRPVPEGDQTQEGWSGNFDLEVKNSTVDDMIDAAISENLAGIGIEEINIIDTENYSDGQTKTFVYFDCQFKMSKSQGGLTDKVTKKLDWQASGRIPL